MEENKEITIEYPLDKLFKGANAGLHVHRNNDGGWCMRYGPNDNPRTRHYDGFGKTKHEREGKTTHLSITEDEIERHIVIARREARNAEARLRNLEKLNFELGMHRANTRQHWEPGPTDCENSSAD